MCKAKYALYVKRNMPECFQVILVECLIIDLIALRRWHKPVDREKDYGIIRLTTGDYPLIGACNAKSIISRSQTGGAGRAGHTQSPPGRCQRSNVSGKRVLRSTGSFAGQIRDVAPASDRGSLRCLHSPSFRFFTCYLLPGRETVQRGRIRGASSEVARSKGCPQALGGADCLCRNSFGRGFDASRTGSGRANQDSFRYFGSPAQYRASTCTAAKKTAQIKTTPPSYIEAAQCYEQLRDQALSQLSTKAGLGLFLHRGMAAWMKVWCNDAFAQEKSARDNPVQRRSFAEPDIVMILAGMTLSCTKGGRDEG
jgi:hypothetical protein